jgi:hypothetical protein
MKPTEALTRATTGLSWANYAAIIDGFSQKGIPADEIKPRENVFTFNAWRALGRTVDKGQHGVKVMTVIETTDKDTGQPKKRPWATTVFHISQTKPIKEPTA